KYLAMIYFFFSSRRRHTRSKRDWSSDVCSSDLSIAFARAGTNGFGYDPLFVPDYVGLPGGAVAPNTTRRSYAELTDAEKDAVSHRGRAMEKLAAGLPAFLEQN